MRMLLAGMLLTLAMASPAGADVRRIEVPGLTAVEASGPFTVQVVSGAAPAATLEGSAAALARMLTTFSNGLLKVRDTCWINCGRRNLDVVLKVVAPRIDSLDFSKGIEADVSDVAAGSLRLSVQMGAELDIAGRCDTLEASAKMGADLDASTLVCRQVDVTASMGANAKVHATERVKVKGSMGADVRVLGDPAQRETSGTMGANITSP